MVADAADVLDRAEAQLRAARVRHERVPVRHAFPSYLMDGVREQLRGCFADVPLRAPRIPWVPCVDGRSVERPTAEHFWRVARRPIDFGDTTNAMRARGDFLHLDLGPSGTLQTFARGNLPPTPVHGRRGCSASSAAERDALAKARAAAVGRSHMPRASANSS